MKFPKLELKNRNNKLLYYIRAVAKTKLFPATVYRRRLKKRLAFGNIPDKDYIKKRVRYYNKLSLFFSLPRMGYVLVILECRKEEAYIISTRRNISSISIAS